MQAFADSEHGCTQRVYGIIFAIILPDQSGERDRVARAVNGS